MQRYASTGGSGTACTQGSPCSLETAVEDASVADDDEVIVTPGTYAVVNLAITDAIDLHGQALAATPTIVGSGTTAVDVSDAATVRNLKIEGTNIGINAIAANSTLERLSVHAGAPGGLACAISNSATVRDSLCWESNSNSKGLGANLSTFPGVYTVRLRNVTAVGSFYGVGFDISTSPGADFQIDGRNVIADGGSADVRAASAGGASVTITMASSNYATEQETTGGGGVTATVTDPGTAGNQTPTPIFVNAGAGDFHQTAGSPTIDAGTTDSFTGTGDIDGDFRSLEGDGVCPTAPDIGADEFVGSGPIDCDPPETTISGGPTGSTSDNTPTFDLQSDETPSTFECSVDGAAFAPCTTPFTTAPLADGAHTFEARATDNSSNTDPTPASRAFTVDTSVPADTDPPETTLDKKPKAKIKTKKKSAKVSFAFSSDESGSFECALDKASFSPCASPLTLKAKKGRHTFSVRAVDAAGNTDATPATAGFTIKRKRG
ncbi:MAG: hypothetical protein U0R24_01320 [Solirubrobacterales bacterium]